MPNLNNGSIQNFYPETLESLLKEFNLLITFTKVDGTERKMLCTLKESSIPEKSEVASRKITTNPDVLRVWDIENNGWRSFRAASVTEAVIPDRLI